MKTIARLGLLLLLVLPAAAHDADYTITDNGDGTCTITGYSGIGGSIAIPEKIGDLWVTGIGVDDQEVFSGCATLTEISIPGCVTNIGNYAFAECDLLTTVTILNGVTRTGNNAFWYCSGLLSVTIPNSVTNIGDRAFAGCSSLPSITIPDSVTSIGAGAFDYCSSLSNVYFKGNAPTLSGSGSPDWFRDVPGTAYYLPEKTGWLPTYGELDTVLWNPMVKRDDPFGVLSNGFGFTFTNAGNPVIVVEACTNLFDPMWSPLATNALVNGSSTFSDLQWTNHPARFYRFRSP